jgi:ferredoxin
MPLTRIQSIHGQVDKTVEYHEGHTLLDTAIMSEIDPPHSCMEGVCNTCAAHLLEGQVVGENSGGMILTCQTKPAPGCQFLKVKY